MSDETIEAVSKPDENGEWSTHYDGEEYESIAHVLAEETGEPVEKFQPPEDLEVPHPSELESVEVNDE